MKTRYKLYSEFLASIHIANIARRTLIYCKYGNKIIFDSPFKAWNTSDMKRIFLIKLYIAEILYKKNLSKSIERMEGYELLGRRCMYADHVAIIVNKEEVVNKETGEVLCQLLISNDNRTHPFRVLSNEVQL